MSNGKIMKDNKRTECSRKLTVQVCKSSPFSPVLTMDLRKLCIRTELMNISR